MALNIKQLNDKMTGLEFRSLINTNFTNVKEAIESIDTDTITEEVKESVKNSLELSDTVFGISSTDNSLEGKPFGYVNGTKYIAGITVNGEKVHAVGWYIGGKKVKTGKLLLEASQLAGATVYVDNNGGWTLIKPTQTGQLIQPLGAISDDGKYIDISVSDVWGII